MVWLGAGNSFAGRGTRSAGWAEPPHPSLPQYAAPPMHTTPGPQPHDSPREARIERDSRLYDALRDDIVDRLRPVCAHMKIEDFERLVDDVCALKFRWLMRERED